MEVEGSAKPGIKHHHNFIRVSFETVVANVMIKKLEEVFELQLR